MSNSHSSEFLVLIIDDDHNIRDTIKEIFELEDCRVLTARNGKEGLEVLRKASPKPQLIILDMMMPIMSGREFLDIILADTELSQIPVYIFSANADPEQVYGSQGLIKKPADYSDIYNLILKYK